MRGRFLGKLSVTLVALFLCSYAVQAQSAQNVTEVTLEVAPNSFGPIRSFKITLKQDGSAAYLGTAGVPLIGKYKGVIGRAQFDQIAEVIRAKQFIKMRSSFLPATAFAASQNLPTINAGYIRTTAVINGKRITVIRPTNIRVDSSDRTPEGLLDVESAITRFATRLSWTKEDK